MGFSFEIGIMYVVIHRDEGQFLLLKPLGVRKILFGNIL